jgi:hypothetical protein
MRRIISVLFLSALSVSVLSGCVGGTATTKCSGACPASVTPVSLSMTDDPPSGVSVLYFQADLNTAALTTASGAVVSLLPEVTLGNGTQSGPIAVDVTQLQARSAFLSAQTVPAGSYSGLSLTFSNPQMVIYNASDSALAGSCAIGSVCQIAPAIGSATVTVTTSPFPLTLTAVTPVSLQIDFHLNTVIQSDLSVNLGVANGVTVEQVPSEADSTPLPLGFISGTVAGVTNSSEFTLQTPDNRIYSVETGSSTTYDDFPSSACSTPSSSCVAAGQSVRVQVSGLEADAVMATQVTYAQLAGQETVEGTIIGLIPSASNPFGPPAGFQLLLRSNPSNSSGLPLGAIASVNSSTAVYSVDGDGFTLPSGLSFTGAADLLIGQNVQVDVITTYLSPVSGQPPSGSWGPPQTLSFYTDRVELEPSQLTGTVAAIDSGSQSFTLGGTGTIVFPWPPASGNAPSFNVLTASQTIWQGFTPGNFGGLADSDLVSVSGWIFPSAVSGNPPTLAAQSIALQTTGVF